MTSYASVMNRLMRMTSEELRVFKEKVIKQLTESEKGGRRVQVHHDTPDSEILGALVRGEIVVTDWDSYEISGPSVVTENILTALERTLPESLGHEFIWEDTSGSSSGNRGNKLDTRIDQVSKEINDDK